MSSIIEKVTAFVTRQAADGHSLLLFEHPYAGIQIPAGTVDEDETPEAAVLREVREETGLSSLRICACLGCLERELPAGRKTVLRPVTVYSRPDCISWDWAHLPRGATVTLLREAAGFAQVRFEEHDRWPDSQYVTYGITGWIAEDALTDARRRHFFHVEVDGPTQEEWVVEADYHRWRLFWAPISALPEIAYPQREWLRFLPSAMLRSLLPP